MPKTSSSPEFSLYTAAAERKYPNRDERLRVLHAMEELPEDDALFCLTLAWTGARISEALALTAASFQVETDCVSLITLKRRRLHVREVPLQPWLIARMDRRFEIARRQRDPEARFDRIWKMHRVTGWRLIKRVMARAGVSGRMACPKGLRHGFAVVSLQAEVPLNLTQRWMGHARMSTTAVYADVSGPEEKLFAERLWRFGG